MNAHTSLIRAPAILYDALILLSNSHIVGERASCVSVIKESVSAMEAFMNELGELGRGYEICGQSEKNLLVKLGRSLRDAEVKRISVEEKVRIACEVLSGKRFLKGESPLYQKFSLVVAVRNEMTHPKASVVSISDENLTPPNREKKLMDRLKSYGFVTTPLNSYDWTSAVSNKQFAEWGHLSIAAMMIYVLSLWPYPETVDGYIEMYGLDRYIEKNH